MNGTKKKPKENVSARLFKFCIFLIYCIDLWRVEKALRVTNVGSFWNKLSLRRKEDQEMRLRKFIIQMRWQPRSQTYCLPKWQLHYLTNRKEKQFFRMKLASNIAIGWMVSLFLWLCYNSSKLNLTTVRKSTVNEVVVGLLSFLIVWILDTGNMLLLFFQFELKMAVQFARTKKKICGTHEEKNLWSEQLTILFKKS